MKAIFPLVLLAVLLCFSCGEMPLEPGQAIVSVQDTKTAKVISATSPSANILPGDGQSLIIIEDVDTALYVVADGDTLGMCDAVYHDPTVAWGTGKTVVVVKDNLAYCLTVTTNKDGSEGLTRVALPKDGKATVDKLPDDQCGVKGMHFADGSTHDFSFSGSTLE